MRRCFTFTLLEPLLQSDCELILSLKSQQFDRESNKALFSSVFPQKIDPFEILKKDMQNFTKNIELAVAAGEDSLDYVTQYYFKNPGKHIRPTIALALAKAINSENGAFEMARIKDEQMIFAQVIEMIHCSSLIHDDVIDNGETRRGQIAIHNKVGKKKAVLGGDYLIATASLMCSTAGDMRLMNLISAIMENLARGELIQADSSSVNEDNSLVEYCHKTYFKTASLIAHCCKGIGLYGQEPEKCFEFGKHLGLAFQYVDDILDFTGSSKTLGKPAMNDLKEGLITGPVLFASLYSQELIELLERGCSEEGDLTKAQEIVLSSGIETTRRLALIHLQRALHSVSFIGTDTPAFAVLTSLASKVYSRIS